MAEQDLSFEVFSRRMDEEVGERKMTWEAVGFFAPDGRVYPFGTDSKVISTVFEALAAPIIETIAGEFAYTVESSEQTVYPDFTLTPPSGKPPRLALDIKTTYRRFWASGEVQAFRYTLGSYTSFLRSPGEAKNIKYPYTEYGDHWVIGFLYTRRAGVAAKMYGGHENGERLVCPYQDVEYFVQQKHRIEGESPASGNTANIGSFATSKIEELRGGNGPFAKYGRDTADRYWRHYARDRGSREYSTVEEFLEWERRKEAKHKRGA